MILTDCVKGNFWPKIFRKIGKKFNFWAKIENFKEITQKRLIKPAYSERVVIFTIDTIFWRLWTLILPSNQAIVHFGPKLAKIDPKSALLGSLHGYSLVTSHF